MHERTMEFSVPYDKDSELKRNLTIIYDALKEKGYNPINQIVGYILSEDPTYITTYNNARSLIRHIDRDELQNAITEILQTVTEKEFLCTFCARYGYEELPYSNTVQVDYTIDLDTHLLIKPQY